MRQSIFLDSESREYNLTLLDIERLLDNILNDILTAHIVVDIIKVVRQLCDYIFIRDGTNHSLGGTSTFVHRSFI